MKTPNCSRTRLRSRSAFTLVEMMIALALFLLIGWYVADTFIFASRSETAISKKLVTARALQYIEGRIRRDAKWARKITVKETIAGERGRAIEFSDLKGGKRTYTWDQTSLKMKIPDLVNPNTQVDYDLAKFRYVEFYLTEDGGEGCRMILAPLPMEEREGGPGAKETVWGAAMVGRVELDVRAMPHRYKLYNEPAFP